MEGRRERTWVAVSSAHQYSKSLLLPGHRRSCFLLPVQLERPCGQLWLHAVEMAHIPLALGYSGLGLWLFSLLWWALPLPVEKVLLLEGVAWLLCSKASSDSTGPQAVVPNLSGTRDQFRGRHFLHRTGQGAWFGDDLSALYLLCTLFLSLLLLSAPPQIIRH